MENKNQGSRKEEKVSCDVPSDMGENTRFVKIEVMGVEELVLPSVYTSEEERKKSKDVAETLKDIIGL